MFNNVFLVKQDNEDDEDFDGVLEGFDKSLYEDSDAYKKIQQAIMWVDLKCSRTM